MSAREGKAPAFQLYAGDWISNEGVGTMELDEQGAYIRLLCYQWREGSIPSDPRRLCKLLGFERPHARFQRVWERVSEKFAAEVVVLVDGPVGENGKPERIEVTRQAPEGRLLNGRLHQQQVDREKFLVTQSAKGKASAAARKTDSGATDEITTENHDNEHQPRFDTGSQPVGNRLQPNVNSAVCSLQSSGFSLPPARDPPATDHAGCGVDVTAVDVEREWSLRRKLPAHPTACSPIARDVNVYARKTKASPRELLGQIFDAFPAYRAHVNAPGIGWNLDDSLAAIVGPNGGDASKPTKHVGRLVAWLSGEKPAATAARPAQGRPATPERSSAVPDEFETDRDLERKFGART